MHRTLTIVALAASGLFAATTTATAETITVCASGCQYVSINAAIDAASDGDVILLAAETYYEGVRINTDGKAITLRGATDKSGDPASILDGADSHQLIECQNDEDASTRFENLVIQNGYAANYGAGDGDGGDGGGMYMRDCTPILVNCHFLYNRANNEAGALNVNGSDAHPTLADCIFIGNEAEDGGAIYLEQSNITMTDCRFESNAAIDAGTADGGAFYLNNRCLAVLTRCTFSGNTADRDAGAIYLDGVPGNPESLTMIDCEISNNTAGGDGGGIFARSRAILVMENCAVDGNAATAGDGGGIMNFKDSTATLVGCTLSNNTAGGSGGGVFTGEYDESDVSVTSVTDLVLCGNTPENIGGTQPTGGIQCNSTLVGCSDCTDTDGDGIPDFLDVCSGGDDTADADSDGTPDACDNCPADPAKTEPGDCGCGVVDTTLAGDLDCDGDVDAADFALLRNQIGVANLGCAGSDINGDGEVNGADLAYILSFWGATCP
ncbi:right-handed parallel beta-helix repeat-containing protein [Phycisphaerales bacterium]|nr:right-handed parallel beta-helix repeat-containing protein [Phycisphaerales bacterium]